MRQEAVKIDQEIYEAYRKIKGEGDLKTLFAGAKMAYDVTEISFNAQMNGVGKYQESMELSEGLLKSAREHYENSQITS